MADVKSTIIELSPLGGVNEKGYRIGFLSATTKAAQNDTVTIGRVTEVVDADLRIVATGATETYTFAGTNQIKLTSATTGQVRGTIFYR